MSEFVGIINYEKDLRNSENIINIMNDTLTKKISHSKTFVERNILLKSNFNKPISLEDSGSIYTLAFDGNIYNRKELKKELEKNNIKLDTTSDLELLLKSYITFGYDLPKYLNGPFAIAIWDSSKKELFISA